MRVDERQGVGRARQVDERRGAGCRLTPASQAVVYIGLGTEAEAYSAVSRSE